MMVRNVKNWQSPRARYPVKALTRLGVPLFKGETSPLSVAIIYQHHKILISRGWKLN